MRGAAYLSAVATEVNVVFSFEPSVPTTVMMATEMPAAMRPYSIAVAPDSSFTNFSITFIVMPQCPQVVADFVRFDGLQLSQRYDCQAQTNGASTGTTEFTAAFEALRTESRPVRRLDPHTSEVGR